MITPENIDNANHPEMFEDEVFLANYCFQSEEIKGGQLSADFLGVTYKTKRFGVTAYDMDGKVLSSEYGLRPVFIKKLEKEQVAKSASVKTHPPRTLLQKGEREF